MLWFSQLKKVTENGMIKYNIILGSLAFPYRKMRL